ncbi:MAG: phosphoribosylaminoimidazolesuccinocarboxamide synthase [Gammaproteobacteria bacterium]|nr:phosphoribosylaminoimidazolesuccinocarboxamide synthase [Gammaproteobacteria bacterium]NIM74803.1 phosphoribosylaminoimidazolesuccinocarboxamide synthase [Gammaproteobacteria bacterium]NIN39234.1 phosphoribosylaminoimidazolesuccinocarboxamide synthase [Gammaproteobacteria bacterium]NIO26720.1 phosphoribosylaminoimidazolesuccinocarboxamide synthase [Gammaproteobacteria bacterium]NIO67276.1 phosphoribosylaminoimidazolesuccinocarboxamide synthase [Gammaproteobacteria bacterium]
MAAVVETVFESNLQSLKLINRGKVRDIYAVDEEHMLIVASDRLSAFDVVLPDPIPGKGAVLTELSNFWFARTAELVPNHLSGLLLEDVLGDAEERAQVAAQAVVVKRLDPLPVEAIVRGYLIGSGWKDYQATGQVSGVRLPEGLEQAQRLPETIFTPSTKAAVGDHDENISFDVMADLVGAETAARVRDVSVALYEQAVAYAAERGIIIADTKFEFGLDAEGAIVLIDEVLTPDSSRFWPADEYQVGTSPPSFDKQYVRDYLESIGWNKKPPAPSLPNEVIERTAEKYREARDRLIG